MVTQLDRPDNRANYSRNPQTRERTARPLGNTAAAAHDIRQPLSAAEKIALGVHQTIRDRLSETAQTFAGEKPSKAEHISRALLAQNERLRSDAKEDWTTTQLTQEYIARAVLMSPNASNAQMNRNSGRDVKQSKRRLSEFNDAVLDCATCIQPSVARNFIPMLKQQIIGFSRFADVQPTIIGNNNLESMMRGLAPEVGAYRALQMDGRFTVEAPGVDDDLKGKDLTVGSDEQHMVHLDLGMPGAFRRKIEDGIGYGSILPEDAADTQTYGYVYAGNDKEDGHPRYIVNAGTFGEIDGFDYTSEDQARVVGMVEDIMAYHYGES